MSFLSRIRIPMHWLDINELIDIAVARHHTPYLARHRAGAIAARVRLIAAGFSFLTLLWIILDVVTLSPFQRGVLVTLRLAAASVFIAIALQKDAGKSRAGALTLLAVALAVPLVIYAASQYLIGGTRLEGLGAVNAHLYEGLPFIVLAGLSIFPLVLVEGLAFSFPILALASLGQTAIGGFDWVRQFSILWVLVLALGIYLLAAAIQLHYMMALLRRASYDPLTGVLNRRSGTEIIDLHFQIACEQATPIALVYLDIDEFKSINDKYGHEEGDKALRSVASNLHRCFRRADTVIRWGGEEFVVLLVNTDMNGARVPLARVLADWLGARPDGRPLTASIGVAERIADSITDWPALVDLADRRMLTAKTTGKASVVLGNAERIVPG